MIIPAYCCALDIGQPAPPFTVYTEKALRPDSAALAGRLVIITWKTRETRDDNNSLKNAVRGWLENSPQAHDGVSVVPVLNCHKYLWPILSYCEDRVGAWPRRRGPPLYVDRDGRMFADYDVQLWYVLLPRQQIGVDIVDPLPGCSFLGIINSLELQPGGVLRVDNGGASRGVQHGQRFRDHIGALSDIPPAEGFCGQESIVERSS